MTEVLTQFPLPKLIMLAVLALSIAFAWRTLLRSTKDVRSNINVEDYLLGDDGKVSRAAAFAIGSFFLTTWMLIYMTINGTITEGYYNGFLLAWVAPTLAKILRGPNDPIPPSNSTSVVVTSTSVTPAADPEPPEPNQKP